MFARKSPHSWYWYVLWALLFALLLFFVARYFRRVVRKNLPDAPDAGGQFRTRGKRHQVPMFV